MSVGINIRSPNQRDAFTIILNKRDLTLDILKREITNRTQIPWEEQVIYLRGAIRLDQYDPYARLENLFVNGTCLWVLKNTGRSGFNASTTNNIPEVNFPDPPLVGNFYVFCTRCRTYCVKIFQHFLIISKLIFPIFFF